jgi:hypothetical protein
MGSAEKFITPSGAYDGDLQLLNPKSQNTNTKQITMAQIQIPKHFGSLNIEI